MPQKTPAQLTAATTIEATDLMLTWRPTGPGPLKSLVWSIAKADARDGVLLLTGGAMTGALGIDAGLEGAPGLYVVGDSDTGIFSDTPNTLAFSCAGVERGRITSAGFVGNLTGDVTGNLAGNVTGNASTATLAAEATALENVRTFTITGDVDAPAQNFDGTANVSLTATLDTVNADVGTFGSATQSAQITVDGKGRITAVSNVTIQPGQLTLIETIATTVASPIVFDNIPATYKRLILVLDGVSPSTTAIISFEYSVDNGSNWTGLSNLSSSSLGDANALDGIYNFDNYASGDLVWITAVFGGAVTPTVARQIITPSDPIDALRMSLNIGSFDAGTASLYGES